MTEHMTTEQNADRRSGQDRRMIQQFRPGPERRSGFDRRKINPADPAMLALRATDLRQEVGTWPSPRGGTGAPFHSAPETSLAGVGTVLTQLVSGFYDASMDPKLWPEVLGKMRIVHADNASVISHNFETGQGQLEHSVSIDPMFVAAYREFYSRQNVWLHNQDEIHADRQGVHWSAASRPGGCPRHRFLSLLARPQNVFHHLIGVVEFKITNHSPFVCPRPRRCVLGR